MNKPLLEHLLELRQRLVYCAMAFLISFGVGYYFSSDVFSFLVSPLSELLPGGERHMIYTGLTEAFTTYLNVAFFSAMFLSLPIILWQLWLFMAPGLYKNERMLCLGLMISTPLLFMTGAIVAYYFVCPVAWKFFLSFEGQSASGLPILLEARVSEYLSLVMKLIFAFGLCFELPVLVILLSKIGVVTHDSLKASRKYVFLSIVVVAAIVTPPDIISPISLIIPLYALYEISVFLVKIITLNNVERLKVSA